MNTIKPPNTNLNHFSSPSTFSKFISPLPRRPSPPPPPNSIRRPPQGTTHASLSLSHLSNSSSPHPTNVQQRPAPYPTPLTPLPLLERAATIYGDSPAIMYNNITRTWSETYVRCVKLASSITSLGIKKNDVVSVIAPNVPAMFELHFAVPMAGAMLNTINTRLDSNSISNLLAHSESKLIFVEAQFVSVILEAVSSLPPHQPLPILVLIEDEEIISADYGSKFDHHYENMVENGDINFKWVPPENEWDPISLNYTSGTTASPKGVVISHRSAFLMAVNVLFDWGVPNQPVYLWTLPMFHANGWSFSWGMAAVGGVNVCLRRVEAAAVYEALEKYHVTHMCGAPVVLNMLANYPGRKALKRAVKVMTAGAPPPAAVLGRAEALGFVVSHGYGLTETGGPVVMCTWKQEWDHLSAPERARLKARQGVGSIFSPEVDVVDPYSGESVPHDGTTMGEVILRGNTLMSEYLKDPTTTSLCKKSNGWFFTGDVGVMHSDGYLEVKDRSKDIIICGGENLSSVEVEAVLYTHPIVHEAAVVARPDRYWGETPCAFVSLKEDAGEKPSEKEIREFCKMKLPLFMVPRTVVFVAELPKTSTGKIQKFLLRDRAKDLAKESSDSPVISQFDSKQ